MRFLLAAALLGAALACPALAQDRPQRLLIQISDESPKVWGLALANARNVRHDLGPDKVQIEIVVYGPAIRMLEAESDWRDRVTQVLDEGIRVIACENTLPGDPPSDWQVSGVGDPSIQGFATSMSVRPPDLSAPKIFR